MKTFYNDLNRFLSGELTAALSLNKFAALHYHKRVNPNEGEIVVCAPEDEYQELVYLIHKVTFDNQVQLGLCKNKLAILHTHYESLKDPSAQHAAITLLNVLDYFHGIQNHLVCGKQYSVDEISTIGLNRQKVITTKIKQLKEEVQNLVIKIKNSIKRSARPNYLPQAFHSDYADIYCVEKLKSLLQHNHEMLYKYFKTRPLIKELNFILNLNTYLVTETDIAPDITKAFKFGLENNFFPEKVKNKIVNCMSAHVCEQLSPAEIMETIQYYIKNNQPRFKSCVVYYFLNAKLEELSNAHALLSKKGAIVHTEQLCLELQRYKRYLIHEYNVDEKKPNASTSSQKLTLVNELLAILASEKSYEDKIQTIKADFPMDKIKLLSSHQGLPNRFLVAFISLFSASWADKLKHHGLFSASKGECLVNKIREIDTELLQERDEPSEECVF